MVVGWSGEVKRAWKRPQHGGGRKAIETTGGRSISRFPTVTLKTRLLTSGPGCGFSTAGRPSQRREVGAAPHHGRGGVRDHHDEVAVGGASPRQRLRRRHDAQGGLVLVQHTHLGRTAGWEATGQQRRRAMGAKGGMTLCPQMQTVSQ